MTATELSTAGAAIGITPFAGFAGLEPFFSQTQALPPHVVNLDYPEQSDMDFVRGSIEVVSDTLIGEVTIATSYLQLDDNVLQDFDATPGIAGGQGNPATLGGPLHTARNQHFSQFSQEIRVSNDITDKLNLTTGIFLWKDSIMLQQHSGGVVQTSGQDTESVAIFALVKYDLTDDLSCLLYTSPSPRD